MFISSERVLIGRMIRLFYPFKKQLLLIVICLFIITFSSLSLPLLQKILVDDGILSQNYATVFFFSLFIMGSVGCLSIAEVWKERIRAGMSAAIQINLYTEVYECLSNIDMDYFSEKNTTEIYNDLNIDISKILTICNNNVFFVISQVLSFFGGIIGLFIIDYRLSLVVLIFIPLKYVIVLFLCKKRKLLIDLYIKVNNKFAHWMGDNLSGMKDIRLLGIKKQKSSELITNINSVADNEKQLLVLDSYNFSSDVILMQLLETALYLLGVLFIFDGTLSVGSLFAFITYSAQVMNPISDIINLKYMLTGIFPSAYRYFTLLDDGKKKIEKSGERPINDIETLTFENVCFSYGDNPIFENLNFTICKGEKVAIIGKNGSGKSTIFKLIERFILPTQGAIIVNDHPIEQYDIDLYRHCFSCINQDNHIFDLPILENITVTQSWDKDALNIALELSEMKSLAETHSGKAGLDGANLSGGQRQKLLLARLLLQNRNWCLFDEATSNLDVQAEANFYKLMQGNFSETTVIMIVHQFNCLQLMDKIIKIEDGGTATVFHSYEELIANVPDILQLFQE